MKILKKVAICVTSVFLFFSVFLGIMMTFQKINPLSTRASTDDFTKLTQKEQDSMDDTIVQVWGNPTKLVPLKDQFTIDDIELSGEQWYYLKDDLRANVNVVLDKVQAVEGTHIRILLNGYSLSRKLKLQLESKGIQVSIFDRIPNMSGTGYAYNKNPEKYYLYDKERNTYSIYRETKPEGMDVTNMPTFQEGSYIKVTGSAISPNKRNATSTFKLAANNENTINIFGVNIISGTADGIFEIANASTLNLNQCSILGNRVQQVFAAITVLSIDCNLNCIGNKIYGNTTSRAGYGLQPANPELVGQQADIALMTMRKNNSNTLLYKNNIGAITDCGVNNGFGTYLYYSKAVYLKDVNFVQKLNNFSFETLAQGLAADSMTGTIELVRGIQMLYMGKSPNLNFIVHGSGVNDKGAQISADNSLSIDANAVINKITTAYEEAFEVAGKIWINGTVQSVSTEGQLEIGHTGKATILKGQVANHVINSGNLEVEGTIHILTLLAGNVTVAANSAELPKEMTISTDASLTVAKDVYLDSSLQNYGKIYLAGKLNTVYNQTDGTVYICNNSATMQNLQNYGTLYLVKDVEYSILKEETLNGTICNYGKLHIAGTAQKVVNAGDMTLEGNITQLKVEQGNVTIASSNAQIQDNIYLEEGTNLILAKDISYTVGWQQVVFGGGRFVNYGRLTILGQARFVVNYGKLDIAYIVEDLQFISGEVALVSSDAAIQNAIYIPQDASFTLRNGIDLETSVINDGTLSIIQPPKVQMSRTTTTTIQNLTNNGKFYIQENTNFIVTAGNTIAGNVYNLGQLTVEENASIALTTLAESANVINAGMLQLFCDVNTVSNIKNTTDKSVLQLANTASMQILEGQALQGILYNMGSLSVQGEVANLHMAQGRANIENSANIVKMYLEGGETIFKSSSIQLPESVSIEKDALLTVAENVKVLSSLENKGVLYVQNRASVENILSRGKTVIQDGANINTLVVHAGHTNIEDNAVVDKVEMLDGTLEIQAQAKLVELSFAGQGTLIDHRVHSQSKNMIVLVLSIVGGIIAAILIVVLPIVFIAKRKNLQNALKNVHVQQGKLCVQGNSALKASVATLNTESTLQKLVGKKEETAKDTSQPQNTTIKNLKSYHVQNGKCVRNKKDN